MKKTIAFLLAILMLLGVTACGGSSDGAQGSSAGQSGGSSQSGASTQAGGNSSSGTSGAVEARLTGKLMFIDLDDRDPSILRGVTVKGNCAGTGEFNAKPASTEGIRCAFELNEWVEFYPDTDKEYALRVWALKHRDDWDYYNTCKFSDLMPNFVNYCDLHYPVDSDTPEEWYWGSFYLNPYDCEPGYYDFVFTYEGKAIAVLQTRFYQDAELSGKSDAELEALMKE